MNIKKSYEVTLFLEVEVNPEYFSAGSTPSCEAMLADQLRNVPCRVEIGGNIMGRVTQLAAPHVKGIK